MKNKFSRLILPVIIALGGAQAWAQNARISTVAITTGVVAVTERTAANTNAPVTNTNQPVYVGDNLAGLAFFNGNPGIDGLPASPTSAVLTTLTGALIPGGAGTDLHAFMGYGTLIGPPTLAATYNDVAPLLVANTTYAGLTFVAPDLYPGGPAPLKANEYYSIHHAVNGTDYLSAIVPFTGGGSAVRDIKPMSWPGGVAGGPASIGTPGYFALTFATPTPTGPYFANLFYYLRTDTSAHTQFGYTIPALVSGSLDTLDLTTAVGGFGVGNYTTLAFSPTAFGGYAANQFYYLRQDTGPGGTGNTILGRLDTNPAARTISDIANLGGVFRTLTYVFDATGTAPAWGNSQLFVAGAPMVLGAQSISFAAIPDKTVGNVFTVSPTASSGLDLVVTVVSGPATVLATGPVGINPSQRIFTVTTTGPGVVKLQASQAGSAAPLFVANMMQQSFNVLGLPTVTSATTASATVNSPFTYTITATGDPIISYAATGLPVGILTLNTITGVITGTPLATGVINATVTATNATGTSLASPLTITVAAAPPVPVITSATAAAATVGTVFTYNITASGAPILSYAATGLPGTLLLNPTTGVITGTPGAAGAINATVSATNATGTSLASPLTITVAPAGTVPIITSATTASATVGSVFTYTITATGGPILSYIATGLPGTLLLNPTTGVITGTPGAAGAINATVSATNATGTSLASPLTITVAPAGTVPSITSATTAPATVGSVFTYTITASGAPILSYASTGLPGTLLLNPTTGVITGTPGAAGIINATVSATNATGTSLASPLTITVAPAGTAPIITSATTAPATVGSVFTYTIAATGAPILSYGSTGLPGSLTLNTATGVISGTPLVSEVITATVSATNAIGTSVPTTLTITVGPAAAVPIVTSATSAPATVGTFFAYNITATGAPILSYGATGLPASLVLDPVTGSIGGVPQVSEVITASVTATNATGTSIPSVLTITVAPAFVPPPITLPPGVNVPIITSSITAAGTVGTPFITYIIAATGSPASYTATNLPAGLTLNSLTGAINGTPTTAGTFVIPLSATNAGGTGTSTVTITVAPAGIAPVITSTLSAAATVGKPFITYLIAATGLPTTYTATNLPPGLSVNALTGAINGTPTQAGTTFTTLTATNAAGTGTATLMIVIAPALAAPIFSGPTSAPGTVGAPFVTFPIVATGAPTNYTASGLPPGLTINPLTGTINGTPTVAGTFVVTIQATNSTGTTTTTVTFTIAGQPSSRIVNFSARALSGPGDQTLILGFVVSGNGKNLLVRGIGPGLTPYGVLNVLADPMLTLLSGGSTIATNDDWQTTAAGETNAAGIAALAARVGAFALPNGSKDSALAAVFNSGAHTTSMVRPNSTTGVALTEIYDTDVLADARLINVSARMNVTAGEGALIAGFAIAGDVPKTVLIRGVGPTLSAFAVTGLLADPTLAVFSGATQMATNDNWGTGGSTAAQITTASAQVGAFALVPGSRDAALLLTLQPGTYTVQLTGVGNTTGVALIEIYDVQ